MIGEQVVQKATGLGFLMLKRDLAPSVGRMCPGLSGMARGTPDRPPQLLKMPNLHPQCESLLKTKNTFKRVKWKPLSPDPPEF